eukprot:maker-scaffold460_size165339-snap-gene-0.28 protein:Tk08607 transcript:maker-scaffold460_size165339-snap-gene-0.28-mRNA-1 annotation:"glutathione s-transferase"
MSPKIKLVYFPVRGRGELIRLILKVGGLEYEEDLVTYAQWPAKKPATPFRSLPVLYYKGEEIGQSVAIARFLAKKAKLAGDNEIEKAHADAIVDFVVEAMTKFTEIKLAKDEAEKLRKAEEFTATFFPQFLPATEEFLNKKGGKHFTGNKLSYADLAVFLLVDMLHTQEQLTSGGVAPWQKDILAMLESYPSTVGVYGMVKAKPKVAAYLKARPQYPF